MELKQAIEKIESIDEFKKWKKNHPEYYLAHGFMIKEESPEWQIGYTNGDVVVTFFVEPFKMMPEQQTFKKPEGKIRKLNKEEIKLTFDEAMRIFNTTVQEKYSQESIAKTIILVQKLEKPVYNITGLTQSLKTLNVRISMDGEVLEDSCSSLISEA